MVGMANQLAALRGQYLCDETALIREALEARDGSLRGAAAELGCPIASLVRALARHPQLTGAARSREQYCAQPRTPVRAPANKCSRSRTKTGGGVRTSKQSGSTAKPKARQSAQCAR